MRIFLLSLFICLISFPALAGVKGQRTTEPLDDGETYTSGWTYNEYEQVGVSCKTDQDGILYFDFSNDETNVDTFPSGGFSLSAGIHEFHTAVKLGRYFRFRVENDSGSNQTYLRCYAYYGDNILPSAAPNNQSLALDGDAIAVRPTDFQDEVRIGRRSGVTGWNKFGYREDLTSAGGEEIVWASSGSFVPMESADTFDIEYNPASDGSSANGAKTLAVYYIDSNGLHAVGVHTLGNDGNDTTSFSGLGINRVAVASSGSTDANGAAISIFNTSLHNLQAYLPAGGSVTQQAIFHVGSNHTAVAKWLYFNVNKLSGSNPKVTIKGYVYNRAVDTKYEIFRHVIDTQSDTTLVVKDPIGFNLNPTDVIYFVADTDQNNTIITLRFSLNEYTQN